MKFLIPRRIEKEMVKMENLQKRFSKLSGEGTDLFKVWEDRCNDYKRERMVDRWVEKEAEAYMESEWDDEWKETVEHSHCDHCGRGKKLKVEDTDERGQWAYERACHDFECFYSDVKDSESLNDFFGNIFEVEEVLYEEENEETGEVTEIWITPKELERKELIKKI